MENEKRPEINIDLNALPEAAIHNLMKAEIKEFNKIFIDSLEGRNHTTAFYAYHDDNNMIHSQGCGNPRSTINMMLSLMELTIKQTTPNNETRLDVINAIIEKFEKLYDKCEDEIRQSN